MDSIAKIFFTILMAVMTSATPVMAQEMTVKSMKMEPMDLSASKYSRSDLNGKACALVKVQVPLEGMVFEGNVMGDVENKAGEYWVYLTAGTKFFKIKHRSVSPLFVTFADYGLEPLSARTTYVLQLAAPASAVAQPMEEVTFRVTPANAVLIVDDVERELTNGTLKLQLSCGKHRCTISYPGYHSQGDVFEVTAGAVNKRIYELDPKSGTASATKSAAAPTPIPSATTTDVSAIKAEADTSLKRGYYTHALELYMKISDDPEVQHQIGNIYWEGKGVHQSLAEAARWYRKAAGQGYAPSQHKLGWMFEYGVGARQDYAKAMEWYLIAAEKGHAESQCSLGSMYEYGMGLKQDYAEAMKWYRMAAEQGDVIGQLCMGAFYLYGKGIKKDVDEAILWYRKAAEQGDVRAQLILAEMYYEGKDVVQDRQEAYRWYKKAADAGSSWAKSVISHYKF